MADIELMTTKHSNDIITRLDKLEERIVRKGVPKGMEFKRYHTEGKKVNPTLEGEFKVLYMFVYLPHSDSSELNINGYDFKKETGKTPKRLTIYDENYFINRHYGNLDMPTDYIYVDSWDDFIKYYEKNIDTTGVYRIIIRNDIYINYVWMDQNGETIYEEGKFNMHYILH